MAAENFEQEAQLSSVKESGELGRALEALPASFENALPNEQSASVSSPANVNGLANHSFFGGASAAGPDGSGNARNIGYVPFLIAGFGTAISIALGFLAGWPAGLAAFVVTAILTWLTRKSKA